MTFERRKFFSGWIKEDLDLSKENGHAGYEASKFEEKITYR